MASLTTGLSLGTGSASSLIKSAASLENQLATYQDTVMKDNFNNSLKTAADLATYQTYLNGRITTLQASGTITDLSKVLTLNTESTTALHGSMSADIQRSTIAVLDGQGTNDDKLAAIGNAAQQLYSVGDLSAAQTYESQYYSFYQTVQIQKQTAADALASAAKSNESAYASGVTSAIDSIKGNIQNANAAFSAEGPKFLDSQSNAYLKSQVEATGSKANGSASIFAALGGQVGMLNPGVQLNDNTRYAQGTYTTGSILDIYTQAIIADPTKAATYQTDINNYLNGATGISLPGEGSKSITYTALMNTIYAGNSGNAPYGLEQTADGSWSVAAEHIFGYTFGKDMNGATKLMPSYSFFTSTLPKGTSAALTAAGMNVKQDANGDWYFQSTNQSSFLSKALGTTVPVQGVVQKDGSVQFMTPDGKLLQMVKGQNDKFGIQQVNQFGQVINANVAGQNGFIPPKDQVNVVKGSTAFMTKVLGPSATPTETNGKTVYQANGKLYQIATDTKGLKALQEIDKTGKVINNNVAGQYGFNPASLTRGSNGPDLLGWQHISTLLGQAGNIVPGLEGWLSDNKTADSSDRIHLNSPGWLGVDKLINNAQLMQSVNQVHNAAVLAMAPPIQQSLQLPVPKALPPLKVAAPPTPAALKVAQPAPTSVGNKTANPQQTAPASSLQGGNVNLQGGNVSLQGGSINLQGGKL